MPTPKLLIAGLAAAKLAWTVKSATLIEPSYRLAKSDMEAQIQALKQYIPEEHHDKVDELDTNIALNTVQNLKDAASGLINHKMKESPLWYIVFIIIFTLLLLMGMSLISAIFGFLFSFGLEVLVPFAVLSLCLFLLCIIVDPLREDFLEPMAQSISLWWDRTKTSTQNVANQGRDIVTDNILAERARRAASANDSSE